MMVRNDERACAPSCDAETGSMHWVGHQEKGIIHIWMWNKTEQSWKWLEADGEANGYSGLRYDNPLYRDRDTNGAQDAYLEGWRYLEPVKRPWRMEGEE